MQLLDYIEEKFGAKAAKTLQNIRQGGDNNRKGDAFETYYAAAKVCEVAANCTEMGDIWLSSQDLAFVDDLCLWDKNTNQKTNYQAKNSSGNAASWTEDMEQRFRMQSQVDSEFHGCTNNCQVLLVSCEDKASENEKKIPEDMKANVLSEYFPYHSKSTQIIYLSPKLRADLERICDSEDLSVVDAAYRCVVSAWVCADHERTVSDIIGEAKSLSKPDVFSDLVRETRPLPDWIHRLCMSFPSLSSRVESGKFIIGYNGLEISLSAEQADPTSDELQGLTDIKQVIVFLMSRTQAELTTSGSIDAGGSI